MLTKISLTRFRRDLTRLLPPVIAGETRVILWRHGKPIAALVSMADFDRIWSWGDEEVLGPADPETGKRKGVRWVRDTGWTPERPPLKPRPAEAGGAGETVRKRWRWW